MWDDIIKWGALGATALASAFGYGVLNQRVNGLEAMNTDRSLKLDKLIDMVSEFKDRSHRDMSEIRERLARLESRAENERDGRGH